MTTHERARAHSHAHPVYYDRLWDASNASVYNTCTKFVIMKKIEFFLFFLVSFLTRAYVFLTGSQKVSRKDNACCFFSSSSSFWFVVFFFFSFYRHLLR